MAAAPRTDRDAMSREVRRLLDARVRGDHELVGIQIQRGDGVDAPIALDIRLHGGEIRVPTLEQLDVL